MKQAILVITIAIAAFQPLMAQRASVSPGKKGWIDLQAVQHIGLNSWNDTGYAKDGLPPTSVTEVRGAVNFFIVNRVVGAFFDMGVGITYAPDMKSLDLDKMPMPHSGTKYYLREVYSESGPTKASAHFKATTGFFADFRSTDKLNVMPYLGIGMMTFRNREYVIALKEDGSNMEYNTSYFWGRDSSDYDDAGTTVLGYITGRLNFRYKTGSATSLLFGLEYTWFMNDLRFYGKHANAYNGNVQRSFTVKGNNVSMLGVTVGISFR